MTTVVVAGALANKAGNGGEAWVRLSWVRALAQLGFDVHFVEEIAPTVCTDRFGRPCRPAGSVNAMYFRSVTERFGLRGRAHLLTTDGERVVGRDLSWVEEVADDAALLVNISGHLRIRRLLQRFPQRAYIDLDPGFTQIWNHQGVDLGLADHEMFLTVGRNIGARTCPIPTDGIDWRPVWQPVTLDDWPVVAPDRPSTLTTVASWRGAFGPLSHGGTTYGVKAHEMRRFADLPRLVPQHLELALAIDPADDEDRRRLGAHGWALVDPAEVAADPITFRRYVQRSAGELSVAQGIYVHTRSGWFSDRTVRYLASGRPVLVQETGLGEHIDTGAGLLTFGTQEQAVAGAESIAADWERHARAARQLAAAHFTPAAALRELFDRAELDASVS